jgi:hypothetical protein
VPLVIPWVVPPIVEGLIWAGSAIGTAWGIANMCEDSEEEKLKKRCLELKESVLKTCYGLTGRKRMRCYEAANTTFRQCMGYE